jgi:hypothetical protein
MRAELFLNGSRKCKQIEQCSLHMNSRKARFRKHKECLNVGETCVNAGRPPVMGFQFCTVMDSTSVQLLDKMKKLVKMMNQLKVIKLVSLTKTFLSYCDPWSALDFKVLWSACVQCK